MKKKMIRESESLGSYYSLLDGKSPTDIIILMQGLHETYGPDCYIDYHHDYVSDGESVISVFYTREETDEELATRKKRSESAKIAKKKSDAKRKAKKEEQERFEYERLKAKFG